ncbi:CusA/CzcA family heavy metal efflux RND transporter [Rhodopseudomonas palustris]|uniref:CusA/CzcA family heavy metal efflux RND transporter n=1 Tax=Rhodopseudomonas palustris TaxID=1076 RepID=A0A323UH52_RHOPL|nr:CusA/CzcA family heavy metal efflux RND transporter [Rhodopseudomonas palustris]PZA10286.1 CusA/CzcA family heavy metal efflux RND transporter [Rhodopseudomonas palustris]
MLTRLVEFSLSHRLLIVLATLVLIGAGVLAFRHLPIDAFPDVSPVQVKIIMKAPGMTPEEVETRVTMPLELEMLGIPNKTILRSTTKYGLADVTIDFADGVDIYWARNQVAERLASAMKDMPDGLTGGLAPITTPLGEMFMFTIEGGDLTMAERRTLLDWTIRPALRTLPGVADVNSLGGFVRSFEIVPDNLAMASHGISIDTLEKAIEKNNRNGGAGRLSAGEEVLLVRVDGQVRNLDDLRNIVLASRDGGMVRVRDVAEVRIGSITRYGAVTRDGQGEAVQGLVLGLRGANARDVVDGVRAKFKELEPTLPKGVTLNVFYDRGDLVGRAVGTVSKSLLEAVVLVIVLLILFLGDWRAALVVALTLPLSALATFVLMRWAGMSANLMSLGGLAVAIGMLIDASVVVVENVVSHLAHDRHAAQVPLLHRIYQALREVVVPVTSGIGIIVIVFLPLLTLQGLEGKLFIPVALAIVFALGSSLLLALTVIPVLASLLLKTAGHHDTWLVRKISAGYMPVLRFALRHEKAVLAVSALALVATVFAYGQLGKIFMPTMEEGTPIISVEKLPSIGLEHSVDLDLKIQRAVMEAVPEVKSIVARVGSDELGLDPMGLNQTDTYVILKPEAEWRRPHDKDWLMGEVRKALAGFPGIGFSFTQPIEMRVQEMIIGARGDVVAKIFGTDIPTLNRLAEQITATLKTLKGAEDVRTTLNEGFEYYNVAIDRLQAGRLGLDVDALTEALRTQIEGRQAGIVVEQGRRTPVLIRGTEAFRESPARLPGINLVLGDGKSVPLANVARLERIDGPVKIDRENGRRLALVMSNVSGRDLVGFVDEAKAAVAARVELPEGTSIVWGGQFENQQRAAARLGIVVPIALALVFLLLFVTFSSLRQSLLVFINIPFALIGGVFSLLITGEYLSVPASVGFIALLGIAVLNGLVLVSYFNMLRGQGLPPDQIVELGAQRRLRPILLTASITAFGLVPLLYATGPGADVQRPLAVVVIGGLVTSTLLTLVILPVLYRRFGIPPAPKTQEPQP